MRHVCLAVIIVLAATATREAAAFSGGTSGASGESSSATSCTQCHGAVGMSAPTITVTGLPVSVPAGTAVSFSIIIHRADAVGAGQFCQGTRCAALEMSTNSAGTFVVVAGSGTQVLGSGVDNIVTHIGRKPFDDAGNATFNVSLTNLQAGSRTLFIAANDVNGNGGATGDRVGLLTFPFTVVADRDSDGLVDGVDNCPSVANQNQADGDLDGFGDACDNCAAIANADQRNADNDATGDVCDADDDNDGAADASDN